MTVLLHPGAAKVYFDKYLDGETLEERFIKNPNKTRGHLTDILRALNPLNIFERIDPNSIDVFYKKISDLKIYRLNIHPVDVHSFLQESLTENNKKNVRLLLGSGVPLKDNHYELLINKQMTDAIAVILNTREAEALKVNGLFYSCKLGEISAYERQKEYFKDKREVLENALFIACFNNQKFIAEDLIRSSIRADQLKDSSTAIHQACGHGLYFLVRQMIDNDCASVNCRDAEGKTPLITAVEHNQIEVVKLLLDRGSSLEVSAHQNRIALEVAFQKGSEAMALLLLKEKPVLGRSLIYCPSREMPLAFREICKRKDEMDASLFEEGVYEAFRSKDFYKANLLMSWLPLEKAPFLLLYSIAYAKLADIKDRYEKFSEEEKIAFLSCRYDKSAFLKDLKIKNPSQSIFVSSLFSENDQANVSILLLTTLGEDDTCDFIQQELKSRGISYDADKNILFLSLINKKHQLFFHLAQARKNIEDRGPHGDTLVQVALQFGNEQAFEFLCAEETNLTASNNMDENILHTIAQYGTSTHLGRVLDILKKGFLSNIVYLTDQSSKKGETPLFIACVRNDPLMIHTLFENQKNSLDERCFQLIINNCQLEIFEFFVSKSPKFDSFHLLDRTTLLDKIVENYKKGNENLLVLLVNKILENVDCYRKFSNLGFMKNLKKMHDFRVTALDGKSFKCFKQLIHLSGTSIEIKSNKIFLNIAPNALLCVQSAIFKDPISLNPIIIKDLIPLINAYKLDFLTKTINDWLSKNPAWGTKSKHLKSLLTFKNKRKTIDV